MLRLLAVMALLFSFAAADRDGGPYIGLGYGVSKYNDDGFYAALKDDRTKSATFYGGAYINKHLSVELAYVSFDAWHSSDGYKIDENTSLGFSAISVSTLAHYAFFDDVLDFYAKFGVGEMSRSGIGGSGFTFVYGVGGSFRLDERYSIKLAYDMYDFTYDNSTENAIDTYDMKIHYVYTTLEIQF